MDFRINKPMPGMMASLPVVTPQPPASVAASEHVSVHSKAPEPKDPTLIEQIRDKGMQAYVKELEEKKKAELRQKILQEMGLSEEALAKMNPDARSAIEKMIAQEIAQRMQAENQLNENQKDPKGLSMMDAMGRNAGSKMAQRMAKIDAAGVGLGPLLALQDVQAQRAMSVQGKSEADKNSG